MKQFNPKTYWEERLAKNYDLSGVGYLGFGRAFNGWAYRLRRAVVSRAITELPIDLKKASVLDIGSGTGFYIELWQDLGAAQVSGADLTEFPVGQLRKKFPRATFYQTDIGNPPPTSIAGTFDVISCMDVVFHIVDDARYERAFANIASLLKPSGYFLFSDFFMHRPAVRARHLVKRSLKDIEVVMANAGLEPVSRRPLFCLMNEPVDTPFPWLTASWNRAMDILTKLEPMGWAAGLGLYLTDRMLLRLIKEGPTTELMVCRRATDIGRP